MKKSKKEAKTPTLTQSVNIRPNIFSIPVNSEFPRPIVYDWLQPEEVFTLKEKGYAPISLQLLPRNTQQEHIAYLQYLLMGISDGTVYRVKDQIKGLELEMRSYGLLDKRNYNVNVTAKVSVGTEELWNWGSTRHTLRGNSTVVDPSRRLNMPIESPVEHTLPPAAAPQGPSTPKGVAARQSEKEATAEIVPIAPSLVPSMLPSESTPKAGQSDHKKVRPRSVVQKAVTSVKKVVSKKKGKK